MSNFDDLLKGERIDIEPGKSDGKFDVDKWAEKKKAYREEAYGIIDKTAEQLSDDPKLYQTYLSVQSRFPSYSAGNALLITAQFPNAKRIGDFDYWKSNNAAVKKNQKGFIILEPGNEYQKDDGTMGMSYNPKKVFDVSQTHSKSREVQNNMDQRLLMTALINKCPAEIVGVDDLNGNQAFFDTGKNTIYVQKGLDADDLFRALSKEISHAYLAHENPNYDRNANELKAYSASYMICDRSGISTESHDFSNMKGKFDMLAPQEIREELSDIREAANNISDNMNKVFEYEKKSKEQGQER